MKYELRKGTLGDIHWLSNTMNNPLINGGGFDLYSVAEACWIFTQQLSEVEKMTTQKVKAEVKKFMAELDADAFKELQAHAEKEIKKFYETDTRPKKPHGKANRTARR